jgi:hypothetical protein
MKRALGILLLVCFALLVRNGYPNFIMQFSAPDFPIFEDVDNGDGTVSYALIDRHRDYATGARVAYTKWVLKLPKKYKVVRPSAKGFSASGGGTNFKQAENPNSGIVFYVRWPSLENGNSEPIQSGSSIPDDRTVIRVSIQENKQGSVVQFINDTAKQMGCGWKSTPFPNVYQSIPAQSNKCSAPFVNGYYRYALIVDDQVEATLSCQNKEQNKGCVYYTYIRERHVTGHIALELLPHAKEIHQRITDFVQAATVSDEKFLLK